DIVDAAPVVGPIVHERTERDGRMRRTGMRLAATAAALALMTTGAVVFWPHADAPAAVRRDGGAAIVAKTPAAPVQPAPAASVARRASAEPAPYVASPVRDTIASHDRPAVRPARHVSAPADGAYSPSFASAGTAVFYHTSENGRSALVRADTDDRGSVLRIV